MNILIAPDSFKDCLPAREVALYLEKGIVKALPGARVIRRPVADGGEGTVEAVIASTGGRWVEARVLDPLFRKVNARYAVSGDGLTAVIEMASASGLERLKYEERDPLQTTTFGTGQLIRHALDQGCRTLLLGIGGSATNDLGLGMAAAMGIDFLDCAGNAVNPVGGNLGKVHTIRTGNLDPRIGETRILVACDVRNPLTGPHGASLTYGPQKGGGPEAVLQLENGMIHLADLIREQLGKDVEHIPGSGAAGGLGGGLIAFLGAEAGPGFEMVSRVTGLEAEVMDSDLVITGEGKMDEQTGQGKAPYGVARLARKYGKMVTAVAGIVEDAAGDLFGGEFDRLEELHDPSKEKGWSIKHAPFLLEQAGKEIALWALTR